MPTTPDLTSHLTPDQRSVLENLRTPALIQAYLDETPYSPESQNLRYYHKRKRECQPCRPCDKARACAVLYGKVLVRKLVENKARAKRNHCCCHVEDECRRVELEPLLVESEY